jgi:NADPH:quinone reductase-like Zn-dependent oxidoreductase
MATHPAVVTVAKGAPLEVHQVPTVTPIGNEVRIRTEWTASTPLDLHQNDGALLVNHPQILGDGVAGTVVETGPDAKYKVGDKVFGFTYRNKAEKGHQLYVTAPDYLLGRLPPAFTMQQAVTVPNNFVSAWQASITDLGFELPWPKPRDYVPPQADDWILIWGGSSSVGQFAIQILKYYGYKKILTTSSKAHHAKLKKYGAAQCFDYREQNVSEAIMSFVKQNSTSDGFKIKYIMDSIGSQSGSVQPLAQIAQADSTVAIMLPVIVRDAAEGVEPIYEMDVRKAANWAEGVDARGVRTHFYLQNEFLKEKLQSEIMPKALTERIVEPNDQVEVEGKTLLERAEKAMGMLRKKQTSGERLVWRIAEEAEV